MAIKLQPRGEIDDFKRLHIQSRSSKNDVKLKEGETLKIKPYVYYISQDKWQDFLQNYEQFGFKREGGFAYPDYVYRKANNEKDIEIRIDKTCVNMWDDEDKNSQREIWLWDKNYKDDRRYGTSDKETILPYIKDLVDAGFVENNKEDNPT